MFRKISKAIPGGRFKVGELLAKKVSLKLKEEHGTISSNLFSTQEDFKGFRKRDCAVLEKAEEG